jgi:two-component system, chemotaxis family, chemotaxis protein CheY
MDSSLQKDQDDLQRTKNGKRILVVDDEKPMRDTIKSLLEDTELYSVQTAQDGEAAISLLKQHSFDLLITDYNMPRMNGYELFQRCKTISSKLPVIFLTGNKYNAREIEKIASQSNVFCIYKPFNAKRLFHIVDILIRTNSI